MKVLKDFNNKLCDRVEYEIEIIHDKKETPKREDVKKNIAKLLKIKEDLIALKGIYTKYGISKSKVYVNIYNNEESFKNFEIRNKKKKNDKKKKTKK